MSIRPYRDINRRKTKVVNLGNIKVGGDNPISVQSMTNTLTTDIKATINQINEIQNEGADLVRVSCPDQSSTKALKEIIKNVSIPVIADIHFHYKRAIEAAESGANCLRINPGNIGCSDDRGYLIFDYHDATSFSEPIDGWFKQHFTGEEAKKWYKKSFGKQLEKEEEIKGEKNEVEG